MSSSSSLMPAGLQRWPSSSPFAESENLLPVAITARAFAQRPSRMLGISDPVLALDLDLAAAGRLLHHDSGADRGGSPEVVFGAPEQKTAGQRIRLDQF